MSNDLDLILAILLGQKILDENGVWHVFDADGTEIGDPNGILLRANPGALLTWPKESEEQVQEKSGEQRLWMYQLYADAIEEDRKKREAKLTAVPKQTPKEAPQEPLEVTPAPKPLPVFAPVFTSPQETTILDNIISEVVGQPLPKLTIVPKARSLDEKTSQIFETETFEDDEEETLFLLMAA